MAIKNIDRYLIDLDFIPNLSQYLDRFKQIKKGTWNFRCPVCGDSHKNKYKARGYIYEKNGSFGVKCHNCEYTSSLYNFIKDHTDEAFFKKYTMEIFKKKNEEKKKQKKVERKKEIVRKKGIISELEKISTLPKSHKAKRYCDSRKIPLKYQSKLYYCDDFSKFEKEFPDFKNRLPKDERIIIPYFNKKKHVFAFQGRSLDPKAKIRYLTLKYNKNAPLIYGVESWNKEKTTFVTEGPIDSMFLPNSLAATGADFGKLEKYIDKEKTIFIFDNEKRNKQINDKIEGIISKGLKVVIWNNSIKCKDINDIILKEMNQKKLLYFLMKNNYNGLKAKLKFKEWRRA